MGAEIQNFDRLLAAITAAAHASLTTEQKAQLGGTLPRNVVKTRPQSGQNLRYVEGWYVIDRLNSVFGFDGWSFEPGAITITAFGDKSVVHVPVTLRACGTQRGDVGAAVTAGKSADALETALKAAVTDGLKRAARTFGTTFGNRLYDKAGSGIGVSTHAEAMLDEIDSTVSVAEVNTWVKINKERVAKLEGDEQDIVKGACATRRRELATDATEPPSQPATESEARTAQQPTSAAQPTRPVDARPSALDVYRSRCAEAPTLDILAATHLELSPTVAKIADDAKTVLRARAVALGGTHEEIAKAITTGLAASKDPSHWAVVTKALLALHAATSRELVVGVVRTHGAAVSALPETLKTSINAARTARLAEIAALPSTDVAAQIEDEIRRASTIPDLDAIHDRITAAVTAKTLTADQAKALVDQYNKAVDSLERGPAEAAA